MNLTKEFFAVSSAQEKPQRRKMQLVANLDFCWFMKRTGRSFAIRTIPGYILTWRAGISDL